MGRGHSKLPFKIVLIHFVNKSLFKVLYWTSLEIERCHQRFFSFIQKSPLPIFKIRCILFQMAVIFEVKLKRQVPLKQIWIHFTDWVGGMCDGGRQSCATTGSLHHVSTGLCQFLPQGGHLRVLGIIHHEHMDVSTWYFSQPICAIHASGLFSCGGGDDCI